MPLIFTYLSSRRDISPTCDGDQNPVYFNILTGDTIAMFAYDELIFESAPIIW